ncbi:MAG: hypothetical protein F4004_10335 [Acidimicrobiia bacterium]|nr:hypothetical protein [Acidimicrobiia bacterium]MYC44636.1 hypothetical protein [Acidimicrobiia bacterium]
MELLAGRQPFSNDHDGWTALRANLGATTITISEFPATAAIQSIRVDLTPDEWPSHPTPLTDELGRVFVDDNSSDYKSLRNYVDVIRIGGDETVVSQLRTLIGADHALATRCHTSLEAIAQKAERVLIPLIIDLDRLSESDFESAAELVQDARRALASVDAELQIIARHQGDLQELLRLSELRKEQETLGPSAKAALDESTERVVSLTARKTGLEETLRSLISKHASLEQLYDAIDKLWRLRDGRLNRAARTHSIAQRALQQAELNTDTLSVAIRTALKDRRSLIVERSALASLPELVEMIETTRAPLAEVEGSSLDTEVVAIIDRTQRMSAAVLRLGLDARSKELELDTAYDSLANIDRQLREVNSRLEQLKEIRKLVRDAERKSMLLAEVENRLGSLARELRDETGDEYSQVADQLRDVESELTDAIKREAECKLHFAQLNRSGGAEALRTKISELESLLEISCDQATEVLRESVNRHEQLSAQRQQRREELVARERSYQALEEQLARAIQLVARSADYQWLRDSIAANQFPTTRTERLDAIRQLTQLANSAKRVQSELEQSLKHAAMVQETLYGIAQAISTHRTPSQNPHADSLIRYYENHMAEYLSNQDIREALFDGGMFRRFDLMNGLVSWRTKAGEPRRRPIEAFSSGERAFAYMLAAILSHRESTAQNRVFFLDEFGAFVEENRRSRLWHFLDERLLKPGVAAQVVVILPSQSSGPSDLEPERFEQEGYFAVKAPL